MAWNSLQFFYMIFFSEFLQEFRQNVSRFFSSYSSMNHTRNLSSNSANYTVLESLKVLKRLLEIFIRISLQMHSETTPKIGPKYDLFIIFIIETSAVRWFVSAKSIIYEVCLQSILQFLTMRILHRGFSSNMSRDFR